MIVSVSEWKLHIFYELYEMLSIAQVVIFCNTSKTVDMVTEKLRGRDFTVSALVSFNIILI
jgi:translation initiation factor 4A